MHRRFVLLAVLAGFMLVPRLSSGHHPLSERYDRARTMVLTGTVSAVEWVNPHVVLTLEVTTGERVLAWRVELDPPGALARRGWSRDQLTAGDRVLVTAYPSKDGGPAAVARTVELPGGTRLEATTDSSWHWARAGRAAR